MIIDSCEVVLRFLRTSKLTIVIPFIRSLTVRSAVRKDTVRNVFGFANMANAFLWLNRQSSSFNDAFRVEKVKLAMYLILLFT